MQKLDTSFIEFQVDQSAVATFVHSQNGCIGRSIIELISNAIDAKSEGVSVVINETGFKVTDAGKGFGTKDEVTRYFGTFGTPHEAGDSVFGRFRIGRGQIMQFGRTVWRSNSHEMIADIENKGYGFEYRELPAADCVRGCVVEGVFYEPLSKWDLNRALQTIQETCKYISTPVHINGSQINKPIAEGDWDYECDEYKVKWYNDRGEHEGVSIYNQGALVKEYARGIFGVGADVVTTGKIELNTSRTEINQNDPVWRKIQRHLKEEGLQFRKRLLKNKKMTEAVRSRIIEDCFAEEIDADDLFDLSILRDARGRFFKVSALAGKAVSIGTRKDATLAESVMLQKLGIVLHPGELEAWGMGSIHALLHYLLVDLPYENNASAKTFDSCRQIYCNLNIVDFESLSQGLDTETKIIPQKELNPREKAARNALEYASGIMAKRLSNLTEKHVRRRKIQVGESTCYDGWTDASSCITTNRNMLSLLDKGRWGAVQLSILMLHEYCHDKNHPDTDTHGEVFYEKFHELISDSSANELIGHASASLFDRYNKQLIANNEPLPTATLSEFKWPVINDQAVYICELGPKRLSEFAKQVLAVTRVGFKLTAKQLTLFHPNVKQEEIWARVARFSEEVVETYINHDDWDLIEPDDYSALRKQEQAKVIAAAKLWAKDLGYDKSAAVLFFLGRYSRESCWLESIVRVLIEDKDSEVLSYSYESLRRNYIVGGAKFRHSKLNHWDMNGVFLGGERISAPQKYLQRGSAERELYALEKVRDIVASFVDDSERLAFVQKLFNQEYLASTTILQEDV